jgi:beta-galactosidase
MRKDMSIHLDHITLGVCYYPEQWPQSIWEDDLRRMQDHGIEVARVFEFAWSVVEPREGEFDFTLFDKFLALAQRSGMKIILCTPTATPPAWLTKKYPEVLNADMLGNRMAHGHRRHYNYNSPVYRSFTEKIVTALAVRYGDHPAVIGWQLDNEFNCEADAFYSDSDREAFRQYIKDHFQTLDNFNDAIGARFWNQTYSSWDQVDMERHTIHDHANPHMALLEKRFISKSTVSYAKLQSDILRKHIGSRFVTTNGIYGHLDNFELTDTALDFTAYDIYPNFGYGRDNLQTPVKEGLGDRFSGLRLSYARAASPNFGVMEQQAGAHGWDFRMLSPMPAPGQIRLWTMQSIAHGADFVSFFRWRTAPYGTEIYWHGLNDYGNQPNRRLAELMEIYKDVKMLSSLAGSRYHAQVALMSDYLNEWDGERDLWHGPLSDASRQSIYEAAQYSHTPLDLVYIRKTNNHVTTLDELLPYKMLIYPHPAILTEDTAKLLKEYCESGGVLVMGVRTGYKDEYGRCPMQPMPGFARELCGAEVEDYTFARPEEPPVKIIWNGTAYEAPIFHDILKPVLGGEVLAAFESGYYSGKPAFIRKRYDNGGAAYYLGAGFSREITEEILRNHHMAAPYSNVLVCPQAVELAVRKKEEKTYFFVLNYAGKTQTFPILQPLFDMLTGQTASGLYDLPPYGAGVFLL